MKLELKGKGCTLHLLGVEAGAVLPGGRVLVSAQAAVNSAAAFRGDTYRVVRADVPAWNGRRIELGRALKPGWSVFGCDPKETDMHHLDFLIPLSVIPD